MTREERNIKLHTNYFDGIVYAGLGSKYESVDRWLNQGDAYCIRANTIPQLLVSINTIAYTDLYHLPTPTSDMMVATFGERGIIFVESYHFTYYRIYSEVKKFVEGIIKDLFIRSYGLKVDVESTPVGVILDFGENGKYYVCEDFRYTHRMCITLQRTKSKTSVSKKIFDLLGAEYVNPNKNPKFVGHEIFNLHFKEEKEEEEAQ